MSDGPQRCTGAVQPGQPACSPGLPSRRFEVRPGCTTRLMHDDASAVLHVLRDMVCGVMGIAQWQGPESPAQQLLPRMRCPAHVELQDCGPESIATLACGLQVFPGRV